MANVQLKVHVDMESLFRTRGGLNRFDYLLRLESRRAVRTTTVQTADFAKKVAPVGETGELRDKITWRLNAESTRGIVDSKDPASQAVDMGAKPHVIEPRIAGALTIPIQQWTLGGPIYRQTNSNMGGRGIGQRSKKIFTTVSKRLSHRIGQKSIFGGTRMTKGQTRLDVDFTFSQHVDHPGTGPIPFFRESAKFAERVLIREANMAVDRAIKNSRTIGGR